MTPPDSPSTNSQADDRDGASRRSGRSSGGRGNAGPRIVGRRPGRPADGTNGDTSETLSESAETKAEESPREKREESSQNGGGARRPARRRRGSASEQPSDAAAAEPEGRRSADREAPDTDRADGRARPRPGQEAPASEAIAGLETMLRGIQESINALTERIARAERKLRLGVFVDVPNLIYGAERSDEPINAGKLLDYLAEGRELVRATAYSPVSDNPAEPVAQQKFVAPFVPYEYRIVTKPLKRFADGSIKGNFDVEMAIDMVTMAERLDVIAIVSGDADFARVVEVIQGRGVRVEVAAFQNSTSAEMRAIADHYTELGSIIRQLR